jgi:NitT/TauT family transport system substrate-binding protein
MFLPDAATCSAGVTSMRVSTEATTIHCARPGGRRHPRSPSLRERLLLASILLSAITCKGSGDEALTLRIGVSQWPGFDVMHHARKERLFEQRGLTVEWMTFDNQPESTRAVTRGSVDAAFSSVWDTIHVDAGKDSPVLILVTDVSHGADGITARPGIASMADLRGKRVAVRLGTITQLILTEALALHGMTPDDIEMVDIDMQETERLMDEGAIDATVSWEPKLSRITAKTSGATVFTTREVDSLAVDGLVTSQKALDHKREALIRLLMVWLDVMHDLETRPDQVYANAGAAIGVDAGTFASSYAGLERGDRSLNEEMFGQGRLLRAIRAHNELPRPHGRTVRSDAIFDAEILTAALARWRPLGSPAAPPE